VKVYFFFLKKKKKKKKLPNYLLNGSKFRPEDIYLANFNNFEPAAIDVTVVSPIQQAYVKENKVQALISTINAAKAKHQKYDQYCSRNGVAFVALAVENFGGIGEGGRTLIETKRNFPSFIYRCFGPQGTSGVTGTKFF